MRHLINLELRKNNFGWYIKGAIIANIIILGLLYMMVMLEKLEGEVIFSTPDEFFTISGVLVRSTFIVFAAVLISKIIIEEFKNNTILILFSYPVSRKKIMGAKILIVFVLTLVTMIVSTLFVNFSFAGFNQFLMLVPGLDMNIFEFATNISGQLMFSIVSAGTSLVPLYFGMRNYSVPATIVSSLIIIFFTSSSIGPEFSLANIFYIPLALSILAAVIVYLAIKNINKIDLRK